MTPKDIKLSYTSKMPGASFSLSALKCITGSKLHEQVGSVCSKCYARRGRYLFPNVVNAQNRRIEQVNDKDFVECMTEVLSNDKITQKTKLFRWHDSGDLQSIEHLEKLVQIARNLPNIRFWLPTKEYGIINKYGTRLSGASNLTIRVSHPMINNKFTTQDSFYKNTSSVFSKDKINELTDIEICQATVTHTTCNDNGCTKCWNDSIKNIIYIKH